MCIRTPLDLAHNLIEILPGTSFWSCLPLLQSLNLEANRLVDLAAVQVLNACPLLDHLTLLGNPIAQLPQYRSYVVNTLRQLKA